MKSNPFLFCLLLFPLFSFGQTKYYYDYPIRLKSQSSAYQAQIDTANHGKTILNFVVSDNQGFPVPFASIKIKSEQLDTLLFADENGLASINVQEDTFDISIFAFGYTLLRPDKIYLKKGAMLTIKAKIGRSNLLALGHIHSTRQPTQIEIDEIIDIFSYDKPGNNLIKNKTCYVLWEI